MSDNDRMGPDKGVPTDGRDAGKPSRPPLWEPSVKKKKSLLLPVLAGVLVLGSAIVLYLPVVERTILTSPRERIEVVVVGTVGAVPADDLRPGYYRIRVRLPSGQETPFTAPQPHAPGTALEVSRAEGRLTGRIWLDGPVRLLRTSGNDLE